jgi:hypothetical protein
MPPAYDAVQLTYTNKVVNPVYSIDDQISLTFKLKASVTYPAGSLVGEVTATPGTFGLYASGNSDGTQNPKAVLDVDYITDAAGLIYMGAQVGGQQGETATEARGWFSGAFRMSDVPNLDATAITNGAFRILFGTVAANNGQFKIT